MKHTDMLDKPKATYSIGDYIKFYLAFDTQRNELKGVVQKCWASSDGLRNEYVLIKDR